MRSLCLVALVLLSGCHLYFNDGDDDCYYAELSPAQPLRDPQTGECKPVGGGGGWCDGREAPAISIAIPDWGSCYGHCDSLDVSTCMATTGCRAAFLQNPFNDGPPEFWGCWEVAMSGPVRGGGCTNLDAYECSRHDDCTATYAGKSGLPGAQFAQCNPEQVAWCTGDDDCASDQRCTASEECLPPPGCDASSGTSCPAVCYGRCVPQQTGCAAVDCGPGTHCVEECNTTPNSPTDPHCEVSCVPDTACAALPDEAACTARPDCYPVYAGEDCTCDPTGCTCEVLTYDRCQSWNDMTPPPGPNSQP